MFIVCTALLGACSAPSSDGVDHNDQSDQDQTRLVVLGMIHSGHRTSERYSTDVLADAIRRIRPDVVLCEIPPDRLEVGRDEFSRTGNITEPRVSRFPEYVDVLFPLTREFPFEIVACAGWTKAMSDDRATKMNAWQTSRASEMSEIENAEKWAGTQLAAASEAAGLSVDDPRFINSDRYDEITKQGLEPYDRLLNEDLGPGGWTNINEAHYALIATALDQHPGKSVLLMFGAGHKYWFLDRLRARSDVELIDPKQFFVP